MRKASNILFNIGFVLGVFNLVFFVAATVLCFSISAPGYTAELITQLKEGKIPSDLPGTFEEQAAQIQHMFLIMAIIFLVVSVLAAASVVISYFAKRNEAKVYNIISIVLGALTGNILFILASIFLLVTKHKEEDGETIIASY